MHKILGSAKRKGRAAGWGWISTGTARGGAEKQTQLKFGKLRPDLMSGCLFGVSSLQLSWPAELHRAAHTKTDPGRGSLLLTDTNKYPLKHRECRK